MTRFENKPLRSGPLRIPIIVFYSILFVLLILDPFIHKHGYFHWDSFPGFYAAFGFVSCTLVNFVVKIFRLFLKRREDYYD